MNKSLKAKNLPLFSIIDLDQLRRENHLEGTEVTDFFTARDGKVYLLMEQPSETQGKDWLSIPSTYTAVEIQLDWAEQRVLETTLFPLGLLKFQFHYLRPAGEHFLLLGARCAYRENGPDQNAWIVSRDGAVLSRFCLGDGIQDCVVKKDGTIITSYFDEGVFGNYGWDEPLGDCGLIAWTSDGTPLWKNEKYSIYDCYAISLDEEESLWPQPELPCKGGRCKRSAPRLGGSGWLHCHQPYHGGGLQGWLLLPGEAGRRLGQRLALHRW